MTTMFDWISSYRHLVTIVDSSNASGKPPQRQRHHLGFPLAPSLLVVLPKPTEGAVAVGAVGLEEGAIGPIGASASGRDEQRCGTSTSAWKSHTATVGLLERRDRARRGNTTESEE
jgi:hypothetical protein